MFSGRLDLCCGVVLDHSELFRDIFGCLEMRFSDGGVEFSMGVGGECISCGQCAEERVRDKEGV